MLMQTNSYVVPKEKRTEHSRLLNRFRQTLARLGCDHFEVFEQTGANWSSESTGRFVQIMRFRDRKHQLAVQAAERSDPQAQALIKEFCDLINFPSQQQQGLFAVGFYNSVLPVTPLRAPSAEPTSDKSDEQKSQETPDASDTATGLEFEPEVVSDEPTDTLERGADLADLDTAQPGENGQAESESEPQQHHSL